MEKHAIVVETGTTLNSAVSIMWDKRDNSLLNVYDSHELQGYVNIDFIQQYYGKSSTVDEVINTDVLAVNSGSLLRDTIRRILRRNAAYVPVVNDDNQLEGIVTRATLTNVVYDTIWGDG